MGAIILPLTIPPFIDEEIEAQSRLGIYAWSYSWYMTNDFKLGPSHGHLPNLGTESTASSVAADRERTRGRKHSADPLWQPWDSLF